MLTKEWYCDPHRQGISLKMLNEAGYTELSNGELITRTVDEYLEDDPLAYVEEGEEEKWLKAQKRLDEKLKSLGPKSGDTILIHYWW